MDDRTRKIIRPSDGWNGARKLLHTYGRERVELFQLDAPTTIELEHQGVEIFVSEGHARIEGDDAPRWTWWRAPARSVEVAPVGSALLWIKSGHLQLG
jgi:hypothetical protein